MLFITHYFGSCRKGCVVAVLHVFEIYVNVYQQQNGENMADMNLHLEWEL